MQQDVRKSPPSRAVPKAPPTEPEAFIRWCASQPRGSGRYELTDRGVEWTGPGTSRKHAQVVANLIRELNRRHDLDHQFITGGEFAVRIGRFVRYPDVLVDQTAIGSDEEAGVYRALRPIFLAEVLSPSSVGRDFVEKTPEYLSLETLRCYLICSQDEPRLWVWNRKRDKSWPEKPDEIAGRTAHVRIAGMKGDVGLAAIFRGIPDAAVIG